MDKVIQFLKENMVCCLATCANDKPRASTMEYAVVNSQVMFATDGESVKAGNLKNNNKVSFAAHSMPKFVTIDGTTATPDEDEINAFNRILFERHPDFKEMVEKGTMRPFAYYKIVPEVVYFSDYSNGMAPPEIIKY